MVTAVVESPLRQRQLQRLRSPLAATTSGGGGDDFEVRHLRPAKRSSGSAAGGMRGRSAPPEIEIPNANGLDAGVAAAGGGGGGGGWRGYTSLRDIMASPEYAAAKASSPDDQPPGGVGGGGTGAAMAGDVHMIRHPLVKHAAYAYLQLTPSARDAEARRRMLQRRRGGGGPLGRLFLGCLGFLGALFRRR